jgi:hypothetical protein
MTENYKGQLQAILAKRRFEPPKYRTVRDGKPHETVWHVTVTYGNQTHVVPESIPGSRKHAEQVAAKQVLELMGERIATPSSEALVIETLFNAYNLLKEQPHVLPQGVAGRLGVSLRAGRRYKRYASELKALIERETQSLRTQIRRLEAENRRLKTENSGVHEALTDSRINATLTPKNFPVRK